MGKTKAAAALAGRAWKLLRMAMFWARKGGVFRRRLLQDLRLVPHLQIKSLRPAAGRSDAIHVGEREFSLDETPVFRFKTSRPRSGRMLIHMIPCINPPVDFDDDDEDLFLFNKMTSFGRRSSCASEELEEGEGDKGGSEGDDVGDSRGGAVLYFADEDSRGGDDHQEEVVEKCIDAKAEEFIVKFYERMKLQRQISFLKYNQMLIRSTN